MGLFDNLFLDANTPVTINDGIDHSKDIVQNIVDPTFDAPKPGDMATGGKGDDGTSGSKKDDEKKDGSLVDLFPSKSKEEVDANRTLHPEPPKDIALEIGYSPNIPLVSNPDPAVSFDIGGDMSFDIGGDIPGISDPMMNPGVSQGGALALGTITISSTENIAPDLSNSVDAPHVDPQNTVIAPPVISAGISPITSEKSTEDLSSNNTLFSLLNTPAPNAEKQNEAPSESVVSHGEGASLAPSVSSVFPSLYEDTKTANTSILGEGSGAGGVPLGMESTKSAGVIPSHTDSSLGGSEYPSLAHPVGLGSSNLTESGRMHISSSSKLKSKLSQFLGELESMEFGDESQKAHKMQQIDMCRMRISEIRIEYDTRIRALQGEMQALEQEVRDMDGEKNHIKTVIETFQKELDMA